MRRGIRTCIAAVLLLAVCSLGAIRAATTYTDPGGAFSFAVPDGYAVIPNGPIPALVTIGPTEIADATFSVDAEAIPNNGDTPATLNSLVADLEAVLASNYGTMTPGVEPVQILTLGGEEARRVDFVQTENGTRYHGVVVFTFHNALIWSIIVLAEPKDYDAVIQQTKIAIDSFTFLSAPSDTRTPVPTITSRVTSTPTFLRRLGEG